MAYTLTKFTTTRNERVSELLRSTTTDAPEYSLFSAGDNGSNLEYNRYRYLFTLCLWKIAKIQPLRSMLVGVFAVFLFIVFPRGGYMAMLIYSRSVSVYFPGLYLLF